MSAETPVLQRLDLVRRRLASCQTVEATLMALSDVDLPILRVLEPEYTFRQWPADELREQLACAHVRLIQEKVLMSTEGVSAGVVAGWAVGTLQEWLGGYTDFIEELGGQFRLQLLDDGQEPSAACLLVEVSTVQGLDPRRFQVTVSVTERPLPAAA